MYLDQKQRAILILVPLILGLWFASANIFDHLMGAVVVLAVCAIGTSVLIFLDGKIRNQEKRIRKLQEEIDRKQQELENTGYFWRN